VTAVYYMFTELDVGSISHSPFRVWADIQIHKHRDYTITDATDYTTHVSASIDMDTYKFRS